MAWQVIDIRWDKYNKEKAKKDRKCLFFALFVHCFVILLKSVRLKKERKEIYDN